RRAPDAIAAGRRAQPCVRAAGAVGDARGAPGRARTAALARARPPALGGAAAPGQLRAERQPCRAHSRGVGAGGTVRRGLPPLLRGDRLAAAGRADRPPGPPCAGGRGGPPAWPERRPGAALLRLVRGVGAALPRAALRALVCRSPGEVGRLAAAAAAGATVRVPGGAGPDPVSVPSLDRGVAQPDRFPGGRGTARRSAGGGLEAS